MTPSHISQQFIQYLKEQGGYDQLPEIVQLLEKEVERNQDITVISSVELASKEQGELEKTLLKKWGEHRVIFTTDPILLSGIIVKFKDQVLDASGRGALISLKQEL